MIYWLQMVLPYRSYYIDGQSSLYLNNNPVNCLRAIDSMGPPMLFTYWNVHSVSVVRAVFGYALP